MDSPVLQGRREEPGLRVHPDSKVTLAQLVLPGLQDQLELAAIRETLERQVELVQLEPLAPGAQSDQLDQQEVPAALDHPVVKALPVSLDPKGLKVQLASLVLLGRRVRKVYRGRSEHKALAVTSVEQVHLEQLERQVALVHRVRPDFKVYRVSQVQLVYRVNLALPVHKDYKVRKDRRVKREC